MFENYRKNPQLFYENKLRTSELFELLKQEILSTKETTSSKLEDTLTTNDTEFDFYTKLLVIIFHHCFGNIRKRNDEIDNIFHKIIRIKKYHKVLEAIEILEKNKISQKDLKFYRDLSNFHLGDVEKSKKYENEIIETVDFNEVTNNYNIYLRNSFILERYLEKRDVYSVEIILEALIRSITEVTLDDVFLKSLSELAFDISSTRIAEAIVDVLESQGQTFGINLDELRSVQKVSKTTPQVDAKTVYDYRYPIYDHYKIDLDSDYSIDKYEKAKILRENEDYIGALSLYREVMDESELNEDLYNNLAYEIAVCYEKMGQLAIAKKLFEHLQRRSPSFRLVKQRLSRLE